MADIATTSRPYARAAFSAAQDAARAGGSLAQWDEFLTLAATVASDARVTPLIGNPRVQSGELVKFILELTGRGAGGKEENFLALLAENRRLPLLPEIAAQFVVMRAAAEHQADVEVRTAMELTPEQLATLNAALTQRLKCTVRIKQVLDPSLIGGAVVRHGDLVFDGSLRGRVERLGAALASA
jgi:F-type H+-transporting ATPase subunit delta